jgi:signal transduction histidine kinase
MEAGRMNEAKTYLDTLLIKGTEYQMKFGRLNAYSGLAEWYGKRGEYKIANEYLVRKLALSDSIVSEETKDKIAMMETRFRVAAKDNEIKALQDEKKIHLLTIRQKNTINYILIGGAAALIVILLLFYRKSQTEKQLAATEAVLKGEEQERARVAKDLHDGLGGMLSGIKHSFSNMKENLIMTPENAQSFERGIQMLDSSIKEMRRVAHNMMPEMLMQYGLNSALKELCIELGRSSGIQASYQPIDMDTVNFSQELSVAAYRVVQELANNAVKHADATTLLVQAHASVEDSLLQLTVEDNGKGVDIRDLDKSQGMGWKSIRNRAELLKGKIDISSLPGKGVSVIIEIPLS